MSSRKNDLSICVSIILCLSFCLQLLVLVSFVSCSPPELEVWASTSLQLTQSSSLTRTGILTMTYRYDRLAASEERQKFNLTHTSCFCLLPLCPGVQSSPPNRAGQQGDDLPLRHASQRGGAHHPGGQEEDDADPPGGPSRTGVQSWLHDQAGTGRHPQVWNRRALQG